MNREALNLWVGVFVVAAFVALLVLSLKVSNLGFGTIKDPYTLKAHFENIGALTERAPVRSAGVLVGRVTRIRYDPQRFDAEVTLSMDGRYQFPKDTTASILTTGLLGEQYIGLDAGGDEEKMKDGDTLKLTQSAVVLERLIGQFLFGKAQETKNNKGDNKQ